MVILVRVLSQANLIINQGVKTRCKNGEAPPRREGHWEGREACSLLDAGNHDVDEAAAEVLFVELLASPLDVILVVQER